MEHIDETKHPQAHPTVRRVKLIPRWVIAAIAVAGVIGIFLLTFFGGR